MHTIFAGQQFSIYKHRCNEKAQKKDGSRRVTTSSRILTSREGQIEIEEDTAKRVEKKRAENEQQKQRSDTQHMDIIRQAEQERLELKNDPRYVGLFECTRKRKDPPQEDAPCLPPPPPAAQSRPLTTVPTSSSSYHSHAPDLSQACLPFLPPHNGHSYSNTTSNPSISSTSTAATTSNSSSLTAFATPQYLHLPPLSYYSVHSYHYDPYFNPTTTPDEV
ncbi:hypothetical protein EV360DRAFT_85279 [Lentinula raphanica]|nr:hypothetical protein EV360DRAFT_85279 [Lentinula raphanica]